MKILLLIFIIGINTYSYSQVELDLYFRDECKNEIKRLEFELIDSAGQILDLNRNKPVLDSIGTYYLYSSLEINNGDDGVLVSANLKILKKGVFTDTIVIPKIRFVTPNALHSSEWEYYNCSQLCDGKEIDYYLNGNKRIEGQYKKGKAIELIEYRPDGTKKSMEFYLNDRFEAYKTIIFNENGVLLKSEVKRFKKRRTITSFYDNQNKLVRKETHKHGKN